MSSSNLSISPDDVRKNRYEFSFLSTAVSLVNNRNFKNGEFDIYQKKTDSDELIDDTKNSYIWRTLSAISEDIGGVLQENVANFIDNVSNIELCKIKALQSMTEFTGTKYSVFQNIIDFPRELVQLMDILSIKREYLVNLLKIDNNFYTKITQSAFIQPDAISDQLSSIISARINNAGLSSHWATYNTDIVSKPYEISGGGYLNDNLLDSVIFSIYKNFIISKLEQNYNDDNRTVIWENLSNVIILSDFVLDNDKLDEINDYKIKHNIDSSFDVEDEYDKIEAGISDLEDYSQYEQYILNIEKNRRVEPYLLSASQTKYKYYRETEVREYYKFVKNEYIQLCATYLSAEIYPIDNSYILINDNDSNLSSLLTLVTEEHHDYQRKIQLNQKAIDYAAQLVTRITSEIRSIREQLKVQCQKNCMKGTYVLISYIINEYLKNNLRQELSSFLKIIPEYDYTKNKVDFIEYIDPTEYFNISTDNDTAEISGLNDRYWERSTSLEAIGAIDNTNIFADLPTLDSNNFAFSLSIIEDFYLQVLQTKFAVDKTLVIDYPELSSSSAQQKYHFYNFLSTIFDLGADETYYDNGMLCTFGQPYISAYKEDMFYRYTGLSIGDEPYCNIKNQRHPSYQIHPYLSNFMEYYEYSYPIENTVNLAANELTELIKNNISDFIDDDGYLINLWHNPLNSNSDYQSRYEVASHLDKNNNENRLFSYDGLFYPTTLSILSDDTLIYKFLNSVLNADLSNGNYEYGYYGLDLTYDNRKAIVDQISAFRNVILCCASQPYDISRYGIDAYGNSYILVKNLSCSNINAVQQYLPDDKEDVYGTLWIRIKNHPLAFPAYVLSASAGSISNLLSVSQCYIKDSSDSLANQVFISERIYNYTLSSDYNQNSELFTPAIYDFSFSNDKTYLIIEAASKNTEDSSDKSLSRWPLLAFPSIIKSRTKSLNRDVFKLNRNGNDEKLLNYGIQHILGFNEYRKACWFTQDLQSGIIYWKFDSQTRQLSLVFCGYKMSNNSNYTILGGTSNVCVKTLDYTPINNDIKFDSYYSSTDKSYHIVACYIADRPVLSNVTNYQGYEFNYNSISSSCNIFQQQIIVNDFTMLIEDSIYFNLTKSNIYEQHYLPYTNCGFNPVHIGINRFESTKLAGKKSRSIRPILKFQIIDNNYSASDEMIDFKYVMPVRMFESYDIDNSLSLADLTKMHFLESDVELSVHNNIDFGTNPIYDPYEYGTVIKTSDISVQVDESYINLLRETGYLDDPADHTVNYPFLWNYSDEHGLHDIPNEYIYSFKHDDTLSSKDKCIIKMRDDIDISVSYGFNKYSSEIQLDFNSFYYYGRTSKDDIYKNNIFNRKHLFLNLEYPGDAGWLYIYNQAIANGININVNPIARFYIKNISDNERSMAKFLLSAFYSDEETYIDQYIFITESGTTSETLQPYPDTVIVLDYNGGEQIPLAAEDILD